MALGTGLVASIHPCKVCTGNFVFQLANVDVIGALDMFADKGEWDKCLQMAEQQVRAFSFTLSSLSLQLQMNQQLIFCVI